LGSKRGRNKKGQKSQNDSKTKTIKSDNLENDDWTKCPGCGTSVKTKNLSSHLDRIHPELSKTDKKQMIGDSKRTKSKVDRKFKKSQINKEKLSRRRRQDMFFISIIIIIFSSIIGGYYFYEYYLRTDENNNSQSVTDENNNQPEPSPQDNNWLDSYSPKYTIGSGDNNWWIYYPDIHPNKGENVAHLEWIKQDLNNKPVLFVIHRTGCISCQPQSEKSAEIGKKYQDDLIFYDLDVADGSSTYDKGMEAFMYDPDDAENYIALTGVFTKMKDNSGNKKIAWHSWEFDMDKSVLESWVKDAIYHYKLN
jgi:hypothetical protein